MQIETPLELPHTELLYDLDICETECIEDEHRGNPVRGAVTGMILGAGMWGAIFMAISYMRH